MSNSSELYDIGFDITNLIFFTIRFTLSSLSEQMNFHHNNYVVVRKSGTKIHYINPYGFMYQHSMTILQLNMHEIGGYDGNVTPDGPNSFILIYIFTQKWSSQVHSYWCPPHTGNP